MRKSIRVGCPAAATAAALALILTGCATKEKVKPQEEARIDLDGGAQIEMVRVPSGKFMMGSSSSEDWHKEDEAPQHEVHIDSFYLAKYELTQAQWQSIMGANPSSLQSPDHPVESVSWYDCQQLIDRLNARVGGPSFRLPTEAEWEYACRAGSETPYYWGKDKEGAMNHAWCDDNAGGQTHPVGQLKPNDWGLCDMCGNVGEWCSDWDGDYQAGSQRNPQGQSSGAAAVVRGGSHMTVFTHYLRSASRDYHAPDERSANLGLRLARDAR